MKQLKTNEVDKVDEEFIFALLVLSMIGSVFLILNSIYFVHVLNIDELQISAFGATVLYLIMKYIAPGAMILIFGTSLISLIKYWRIK